jgi:hypothetical protein
MRTSLAHPAHQLVSDGLYFRFQPTLDLAKDELDDASAESLRALKLHAERLLADREEAARFEPSASC